MMSNYKENKKIYNGESYSYNMSNKLGKISPVDDDKVEITGTRPALNKNYSPIV